MMLIGFDSTKLALRTGLCANKEKGSGFTLPSEDMKENGTAELKRNSP
jgi:hypothetical protein